MPERNNYKKKCELCGGRHITKSNRNRRVCSYCMTNHYKRAKAYLASLPSA